MGIRRRGSLVTDAGAGDPEYGGRFKAFPPGIGHVLVPTGSRAAALAGLAIYAPSRLRGLAAQRIASWIVTALGSGALPARTTSWSPPMPGETWRGLLERWTEIAGGFDQVAIHQRRQRDRPGLSVLLLRDGKPVLFVKVLATEAGRLDEEFRALTLVARSEPSTFRVPRPVTLSEIDGWRYCAMEPLPHGLHRPARRPPLERIVSDIESGLADLPRPSDVPAGWRPMHGDFTPSNLRRVASGGLVLFDWEHAGWGPPGADVVHYLAWSSALGSRRTEYPGDTAEARRFWIDRLTAWPPETDPAAAQLRKRLETAFS